MGHATYIEETNECCGMHGKAT